MGAIYSCSSIQVQKQRVILVQQLHTKLLHSIFFCYCNRKHLKMNQITQLTYTFKFIYSELSECNVQICFQLIVSHVKGMSMQPNIFKQYFLFIKINHLQ